jgi:hypothetical protein
MKLKLLLLSTLMVTPMIALADEAAPEVAPHIFTDLNGNGVSDLEEGLSPGANPSDKGIDQVELPPTPEEEPTEK